MHYWENIPKDMEVDRLLLSEDLGEGFTWGGVTVVNPFTSPRHALLNALLGEHPE